MKWVALFLIVSAVAATTRAVAQEPAPWLPPGEQPPPAPVVEPPPPPEPPAVPPDLVLLTDGGMVRGTIIESAAGRYVVIALPTGEQRRFDGGQVRWAGPTALMPTTLPSPAMPVRPATPPGAVHVHLYSEHAPLTFYLDNGPGSRTRLCTTPCEGDLEPGGHHFVLADLEGGESDAGVALVEASAPALVGQRVSQAGLRTGGWVAFAIFMAAAPSLFAGASVEYGTVAGELASCIRYCYPDNAKHTAADAMVVSGVISLVLGLLMLIPALAHDSASVHAHRYHHS